MMSTRGYDQAELAGISTPAGLQYMTCHVEESNWKPPAVDLAYSLGKADDKSDET